MPRKSRPRAAHAQVQPHFARDVDRRLMEQQMAAIGRFLEQHQFASTDEANAAINALLAQGDLPHIFERFHRAGDVRGRFAGTGIGLAGAQQIVQLHGGELQVHSQEGHGTTVTVRLPLWRRGG